MYPNELSFITPLPVKLCEKVIRKIPRSGTVSIGSKIFIKDKGAKLAKVM